MLLINGKQLEVGSASKDPTNELHLQALEYLKGIEELRTKFGKQLRFVRPGFPRKNRGSDSKGRETELTEPTPPALFPLKTQYISPTRGSEIWTCCMTMPELQPNGLWELGKNSKRSIRIDEFKLVDLDRDPDLAFYLYFISNSAKKGNRLKVDNPKADLKKKADRVRGEVEIKTAIWTMITDDDVLRRLASAYDVPDVNIKEADAIRFELEEKLLANDLRKRKDQTIKGTADFLQEMKITDGVRLRAYLKNLMDEKKITFSPDGRFKLGERVLMQVRINELPRKFDFLCSFFNAPNNNDKLKELLMDTIDGEKLGKFDDKDFTWLAKVMGTNVSFKKKDEIKEAVYALFNIER